MTMNPAQFGQLRMFMTAPEIKATYHPVDQLGGESRDQMWKRKEGEVENHWAVYDDGTGQSLKPQLDAEGVKVPVSVWHGQMSGSVLQDGHHRVAYEAAKHPHRYLPVEHDGNNKFGTNR